MFYGPTKHILPNCGVFNKHNHQYWAVENPQLREQRRLQIRFGFNIIIWCRIYANRLLGPFIFEQTLNGQRYLAMLQTEIVPPISKVVPPIEFLLHFVIYFIIV